MILPAPGLVDQFHQATVATAVPNQSAGADMLIAPDTPVNPPGIIRDNILLLRA
jgi:hypothetical protein